MSYCDCWTNEDGSMVQYTRPLLLVATVKNDRCRPCSKFVIFELCIDSDIENSELIRAEGKRTFQLSLR